MTAQAAPEADYDPPPYVRPVDMDREEKMRLRAAAFRVTKVYPGPAGQVLARELMAAEEFGYVGHRGSLTWQLADQVLKAPIAGR